MDGHNNNNNNGQGFQPQRPNTYSNGNIYSNGNYVQPGPYIFTGDDTGNVPYMPMNVDNIHHSHHPRMPLGQVNPNPSFHPDWFFDEAPKFPHPQPGYLLQQQRQPAIVDGMGIGMAVMNQSPIITPGFNTNPQYDPARRPPNHQVALNPGQGHVAQSDIGQTHGPSPVIKANSTPDSDVFESDIFEAPIDFDWNDFIDAEALDDTPAVQQDKVEQETAVNQTEGQETPSASDATTGGEGPGDVGQVGSNVDNSGRFSRMYADYRASFGQPTNRSQQPFGQASLPPDQPRATAQELPSQMPCLQDSRMSMQHYYNTPGPTPPQYNYKTPTLPTLQDLFTPAPQNLPDQQPQNLPHQQPQNSQLPTPRKRGRPRKGEESPTKKKRPDDQTKREVHAHSCKRCRDRKMKCHFEEGRGSCKGCEKAGVACEGRCQDRRQNAAAMAALDEAKNRYRALALEYLNMFDLLRPSRRDTPEGQRMHMYLGATLLGPGGALRAISERHGKDILRVRGADVFPHLDVIWDGTQRKLADMRARKSALEEAAKAMILFLHGCLLEMINETPGYEQEATFDEIMRASMDSQCNSSMPSYELELSPEIREKSRKHMGKKRQLIHPTIGYELLGLRRQ